MERVKNDEAVVSRAPRDERVGEGIVDHLISFENKRSNNVVVTGVGFHPIKGVCCCCSKEKKRNENGSGEGGFFFFWKDEAAP